MGSASPLADDEGIGHAIRSVGPSSTNSPSSMPSSSGCGAAAKLASRSACAIASCSARRSASIRAASSRGVSIVRSGVCDEVLGLTGTSSRGVALASSCPASAPNARAICRNASRSFWLRRPSSAAGALVGVSACVSGAGAAFGFGGGSARSVN